jgi:hypothetical protein
LTNPDDYGLISKFTALHQIFGIATKRETFCVNIGLFRGLKQPPRDLTNNYEQKSQTELSNQYLFGQDII